MVLSKESRRLHLLLLEYVFQYIHLFNNTEAVKKCRLPVQKAIWKQ